MSDPDHPFFIPSALTWEEPEHSQAVSPPVSLDPEEQSDPAELRKNAEHWKSLFFKAYETIEAWHRIVQWYCAATGGHDIPEHLRPNLILDRFTGITNNGSQGSHDD